ncbi:MAG: CvpA family protein [Lachnospiraceae bacterium]|nr:CvpA family protein [Lachnospiraceae bacterium]
MSWLLMIVLIITLLSVLAGARKGLVRTIVSTFFLVFVTCLSVWLQPYAEDALQKYTNAESYIQKKCETYIEDKLTSTDSPDIVQTGDTAKLETVLRSLGLPSYWTSKLLQGSEQSNYQSLLADSVSDYASTYLTKAIMKILAFALAFLIAIFFIWLVLRAADAVTSLPFISLANRLGGAAAGLVRSLLWIWVFFAILSIFGQTGWGIACMKQIQNNQILRYLYSNNYLLDMILKML